MRYSARDVAVFRAHQLGIPILLGSATPSLESWANAQGKRYGC
jgi:primosomal protein N' (replication factor Y)